MARTYPPGGHQAEERAVPAATGSRSGSGAARAGGPDGRASRRSGILLAALAALGLVHVLALQGHLPGLGSPALTTLLAVGDVQCLRREGPPAWGSWCDAVGLPTGRASLTGIPQVHLAWAVSYLPGVDVWAAFRVVEVATDVAGYAACLALAHRWGVPTAAGVLGAVLYLGSAGVVFVADAYFTVTGFVLLPLAALLFLVAADRVEAGGRAVPALVVAVVPAVMMFTDGYGFVVMAAVTVTLGAARAWRAGGPRSGSAVLTLAWLVSCLAAALAWRASTPPGAADPGQGMGAFRYLGADVLTLVVPNVHLWWTSDWGWDPSGLWGDGSNVAGNYLGLVPVALAGWLLLRAGRELPPRARAELLAWAAVAVVALVLSLGPALKVGEPAVVLDVAWDVPLQHTDGWLPTEWLYAHVPGLTSMRATYRWVILTVLALSLLSAVACGLLWRRGRRALAVLLGVLALVETSLDLPEQWAERRASAEHVQAVRDEVIPDLQALVRDGERVLMLPAGNDFVANAVMPFTGAGAYNAGVDRSYVLAGQQWPARVRRAVVASGGPSQNAAVCRVLREDADVVLLPAFNLHDQGRRWPPPAYIVGDARARTERLLADPRFTTVEGEWFTAVRLVDDRPELCVSRG